MTKHSQFSRCRVCGAEITYDIALGMWTDRPGHPFCPQPIAVTPAQAGTSQDARCDATGSARRMQALMAIGHSPARLARLARCYGAPDSEGDITGLLQPPSRAKITVSRDTYHAICRLYDDLWDQQPPEDSPAEHAEAAAARGLARQHDWPTPAALEDDLIDDPAYQPEGGWLPATLAGVPQRPVPAPPAAPPALITTCRAPAAGLVWPARGHRTSTTVRATAKTHLSRQGVPHGTATA